MIDRSADRPLVTFALFAYNQEEYIREAVEGAFNQTYEPLEIILSDDFSSDRTFEIIEEMVSTYKGPHKIRVNQTRENSGLANHINQVSMLCSGTYVVFAAGDDISIPSRVEKIVSVFELKPSVCSVFSDFQLYPPTNATSISEFNVQQVSANEIFYGGGGVGAGATYAYKAEVLRWPTVLPPNCVSEDRIFPARAVVLGEVLKICEDLIVYRVHEESLHARLKREKRLAREDKQHRLEIFSFLDGMEQLNRLGVFRLRKYKLLFWIGSFLQHCRRSRVKFFGVIFRVLGRKVDNLFLRFFSSNRSKWSEVEK